MVSAPRGTVMIVDRKRNTTNKMMNEYIEHVDLHVEFTESTEENTCSHFNTLPGKVIIMEF